MNALSMQDPKGRLKVITRYIEGADDMLCKFANFLAERLNSQLVPEGFVMACELALYDLEAGVDGFTNQPLNNELVGYPQIVYVLIRMQIPDIADAIFPSEFAHEVKDFISKIKEESDKK